MKVTSLSSAADGKVNADPPPSPREADAGLTSSECFAIAAAACRLPGRWDMEWDEDEGGHASVVLVPGQNSSVGGGCMFLVWRESGRLRVGVGQDDVYVELGARQDVDGIMVAVCVALGTAQAQPGAQPGD